MGLTTNRRARLASQALWTILVIAAPASAFQAAPVTHEMAVAPATKAAPCSAVAIREAMDRKQAPAVTGCRYDDVSGPLMQFHILPLPSPVFNAAAAGMIVGQTPAAGAPATTALLLLQVSKGPKPAQTSTSASSAAASSPSESTSASKSSLASSSSVTVTSSVSTSSASRVDSASASPSASVVSSSSSSAAAVGEGLELGDAIGLFWGAIQAYPLPAAIALAVAALVTAMGLSGRRPKVGVIPRVRCDLEPGRSRLVSSGPLVLGRKGDA